MSEQLWLFAFFLAYFAYCIYIGLRAARGGREPRSFFLPEGGIASWVFIIAVTLAIFAGWNFTGHPAQVFRNGFQFTNASYFVILVPLAGVLVMKRQWILGRRHGWVTPGEMYATYFRTEQMALISVGIAILFAVPFVATLFSATGSLIYGLSDGAISREVGMWGLALILLVYAMTGGMRAVAQVGVVQGVLFLAGMIVIGGLSVDYVGGFKALGSGLAALASAPTAAGMSTRGFGGGDYNGLFAVPGVIQFTAGLGVETPLGGPWTAVMGLSFAVSLMGLQFAPALSVWSYASRTPRAFSIQQIWASAFCVGVVCFVFSALEGMAAHLLGADAAANGAQIATGKMLPALSAAETGDLVMNYIKLMATDQPWLLGFLAVAAIAALQSTLAAYMAAAGNIVSRDVYKRYINPQASWRQQRVMSRLFMLLLTLAALMMASFAMQAVLVLSALAVPFGLQLFPSLIAVLWLPWITRRAAVFGLIAGLVAVVFTEPLGQVLTGNALPWGRWPWTVHSGVWGLFFNVCVIAATMALSGFDADRARREAFHGVYRDPGVAAVGSRMKSAAWVLLLIWLFFAAGPGSILGNGLFGKPGEGIKAWVFGVPSTWAWQIFWWSLGVGIVWFFSERLRLSAASERELAMAANLVLKGDSNDR